MNQRHRNSLLEQRETSAHTTRYSWSSDRTDGFVECELLYDDQGRLLGIDYSTRSEKPGLAERKR
jgi:hypothetical protein